MTKRLKDRRIYISDNGVISCNEPECNCDDGTIEMPGRRVKVKDLLDAMKNHWLGLE